VRWKNLSRVDKMWVKANRTLSGMERVPREYYMVILECSYDAMKSRNLSECNFRWLCKRYTFPCWLLVTLIFCVMDPLPLAGRILLLAGSRCSWRNCKRTTEEKEKYHKSMWAKEKDIIGKHVREKKEKSWLNYIWIYLWNCCLKYKIGEDIGCQVCESCLD
jgi:hypothetical protein